ncbi:MAG: hypothetical protein IJ499_02445 [Clostridia bacterium]|nr:hypothetical protein [Clostridia bacterium]
MKAIKFMITGALLIIMGPLLAIMEISLTPIMLILLVVGIILFIIGLTTPEKESAPQTDPSIPQNKCEKCGKEYDFDYPECPHCKQLK